MKTIFQVIVFACMLLIMACTNSSKHLQNLHIEIENSYTDYDKDHVNDFNYFVDVADSIIYYSNNNDFRNMGLLFDDLVKHKSRATYWGTHTNSTLKDLIDTNILKVEQSLSESCVPEEVTYRINFREVYVEPQNGVITREGYNPSNPFDLYNLSIDKEGYVVRTVRRDNKKIERKPLREVEIVKDLSGEYAFRNFEEMKIERIR